MPDTNKREVRPFCPIHHWRMSLDPGGRNAQPAYRCSYDRCQVAYTVSQGYFDAANPARGQLFLSLVELVPCSHDHRHHPFIVSYAMESQGQHTEEWRQWRCLSGCAFSQRQKLYLTEAALRQSREQRSPSLQHAPALARS
jgi:hypothetical protein